MPTPGLQVPTAGDLGGLVVPAAEPEVLVVLDEGDLRVLGGDHLGGAVGRGVVDDHHLELDALGLRVDRREALAEQLDAVPVDDANGHVGERGGCVLRQAHSKTPQAGVRAVLPSLPRYQFSRRGVNAESEG
jgi:hypothetical protein